jgi:hypothetical protein
MHALGNRCHHLTITKNKFFFFFHAVGWVPPQTAHDVEDNEAAPLEQSRLLSMGKQIWVVNRRLMWYGAVK